MNGKELVFSGPDESMKEMSMGDILADGPADLTTTDSARLVGSGFFTHTRSVNGFC